jgi:hypothetical protein
VSAGHGQEAIGGVPVQPQVYLVMVGAYDDKRPVLVCADEEEAERQAAKWDRENHPQTEDDWAYIESLDFIPARQAQRTDRQLGDRPPGDGGVYSRQETARRLAAGAESFADAVLGYEVSPDDLAGPADREAGQ